MCIYFMVKIYRNFLGKFPIANPETNTVMICRLYQRELLLYHLLNTQPDILNSPKITLLVEWLNTSCEIEITVHVQYQTNYRTKHNQQMP